jgi:hypothetical protein
VITDILFAAEAKPQVGDKIRALEDSSQAKLSWCAIMGCTPTRTGGRSRRRV